jgi:hypothetical protein
LASGKKVNKVLINEFHDHIYNYTEHDAEIHARAIKGKKFNNVWTNYPTKRYAFEVYFMGFRLYSKIATRLWPNTSLVALKCAKAWNDYVQGNDLSQYEYVSKKKKTQLEMKSPRQFYESQSFQQRPQTSQNPGRMRNSGSNYMRRSQDIVRSSANFSVKSPMANRSPFRQSVKFKGRKITVDECQFVFDRVWNATLF